MKIRHLSVRNFRGIRELEWDIPSDVVCLIGPGDATKTTVLDAISYALAPGQFLGLNDADFYKTKTSEEISIEVTITHPPQALLSESNYGLFQRGWSEVTGVTDDPDAASDAALTIRLRVDDALDPSWTVTKESVSEDRFIGWRDRAALQLFRVDDNVNSHLAWGRGSALAALTAEQDEVDTTLTAAHRQARDAAFAAPHDQLNTAAAAAYEHAISLGVPAGPVFRPGLDARAMMGAARLVLHQDNVPLSSAGLGTRRLVALALQRAKIAGGSVVLVDDVESGLEPHRLLHLLQSLRAAVTDSAEPGGLGQILLTTHSADAVAELQAEELHIVRSVDGLTTVRRVPDAFADIEDIDPQAVTRAGAAALLARRIIVTEGRTEIGYLRAMASSWNSARGIPIAHLGTTTTDGGGSQAVGRAIGFARLGYETALFVDSDEPLNPPAATAADAGVRVVQWADGVSIEERIALDLPDDAVERLVRLAIELLDDQEAVLSAIEAQLPAESGVSLTSPDILALVNGRLTVDAVRDAIGKAAKRKKWFKGIEQGQRLGELVSLLLPAMSNSDTAAKTADLERFAYGE